MRPHVQLINKYEKKRKHVKYNKEKQLQDQLKTYKRITILKT